MTDEQGRLEREWSGSFGDDYSGRNTEGAELLAPFWRETLRSTGAKSVLEVGCNIGLNLRPIADIVGDERVHGIDVNPFALQRLAQDRPGIATTVASATSLPFDDGTFDLVFTIGVLIHVHPDSLERVTAEIVRCSRRFVLCGEYFAQEPTTIRYRDREGMLFKRDFGAFYAQRHQALVRVAGGFLPRGTGWDDITWWLFEKRFE